MKFSNTKRLEPRNESLLESSNIDLLKQEVEKTIGRKILFSSDCHFLQNHIFEQLQFTISFNTLRRFFRLMKTKYGHSVYTLDVLSNYCGYSSFNDFVMHKKQCQSIEATQQNSALINYLITIFKNIEIKNINDPTYFNLVGKTIQFLEDQPSYFDEFQREIARTKNGQQFYFEKFIYIDKLNSSYGDGLRYYLHENKSTKAQLFGHALLCLRYWFTGNNIGVERHYKEVMRHEPDETVPPGIAACFFASQLLYAHAFNKPQEHLLAEAKQYYSRLESSEENSPFIIQFILLFTQALVLSAHYEEAAYYIEEGMEQRKNYKLAECDLGAFDAIDLFNGMVKSRTGETSLAKEILASINPNNFHFLHKRYLTILYLTLKQDFQKNTHIDEQIRDLISKTGFSRLTFLM